MKEVANSKVENAGNFLLFSDPGRDLDDELSIALISSWYKDKSRERPVEFLGVITSFGDTPLRARLCRGTLDVLGMGKVPVGEGAADPTIGNTCSTTFADNYLPSKDWKPYDAQSLLEKIYRAVEDNSIDVCLIASMTDFAEFVEQEPDLFTAKTRRVNVMGGALPREDGASPDTYLEPDDSYNCFCDEDASELTYQKCQVRGCESRSG